MYQPVQNGINKAAITVKYEESVPPDHISDFVYCFWQLRTKASLNDDFHYLVLPDACIDIVFDFSQPNLVNVMTPELISEVINLGRKFNYVGVRLYPGVWSKDLDQIIGNNRTDIALGDYSANEIIRSLRVGDFEAQQTKLINIVEHMIEKGIIQPNPTTKRILHNIDQIHDVTDMAKFASMSTRQLQRKIKEYTGYTPHDLLKILRLQKSFNEDYLSLYADQSHYIHHFKHTTGFTPTAYEKTYTAEIYNTRDN